MEAEWVPWMDTRVLLAFPGGAGYGDPKQRDKLAVKRDLARGYISAQTAKSGYGLTDTEIEDVKASIRRGEVV